MSEDGKKRRVIRQTTVYDKRRTEGQQEVAILYAHDDAVYFRCQQAADKDDPTNRLCFLNKQHAIEFASCLLMMALGLPGAIPDADVSFGPEQFGEKGEEEQS